MRVRAPTNPQRRAACAPYTLARVTVRQISSHPRVSVGIHAAAVAALIPAFVFLAPSSRWDHPGWLLVLLLLAVIADFNEIRLPNGLSFDAGLPLALITLAVLGP